jgi:hypothetical protein
MDLTPFIIESAVVVVSAGVVEACSLRQVIFDIVEHERWRFLVASHHLTQMACLLYLVISLDSQGGLGFYSQSTLLFLGNVKGFLLIASARALAAGFVDSHKLMTKGPQGPPMGLILLVVHGIFLTLSFVLCIVLLVTRDTWLAVAMRGLLSFYSIVVGVQVVTSTHKVRSILVEEHKRTAKYGDGIRKLTRLLILVSVLLIAANIAIFVGLEGSVNLARAQSQLAEEQRSFQAMHIFTDFTSFLAPVALLLGAWNTNPKAAATHSSRKSTMLSTEISRRLERGNTHTGSAVQGESTGSNNKEESANTEDRIEAQGP